MALFLTAVLLHASMSNSTMFSDEKLMGFAVITFIHFVVLLTFSILIWVSYSKQEEDEDKEWRLKDVIMNVITFVVQIMFLVYVLIAYLRGMDVFERSAFLSPSALYGIVFFFLFFLTLILSVN